jgi:hypothetical protein
VTPCLYLHVGGSDYNAVSCKSDAVIFFGTEVMFRLRSFKEGRDHRKNICVALGGIIEPGCIDQNDTTAV